MNPRILFATLTLLLAGCSHWVGSWASAQQITEPSNLPPPPGLTSSTLRQMVHVSMGGTELRVRLSNQHGDGPVTVNEAHIAVASGPGAIDTATDRALAFGGRPGVTIAAGQTVVSDPVDFALPALSNVAVTVAFGATATRVTGHPGSRTTSFLQPGNAVTAADLSAAVKTDHWYILSGIDVLASGASRAVVVLGDSITDGRGSTTNGNDRWPDALARRLQATPTTSSIAVLNMGIGGNAVLAGGLGPTALARFEGDVLGQNGVRYLVILEGVNDIGASTSTAVASALIAAYEKLITAAHARRILVYGAPILPFGGSQYDSPDHEAARMTVNSWIRTSGRFDAVIDLDAAVRDPSAPARLLPAYDCGDHLHLNPAGYRRMADVVDLSLFAR